MTELTSVLREKLYYILHRALVRTRQLGWAKDHESVADLGDTFELIPSLMLRWTPDAYDLIRDVLKEFEERHPSLSEGYVRILEMDDEEFQDFYLRPHPWPETPAEIEAALAANHDPHSTAGETR